MAIKTIQRVLEHYPDRYRPVAEPVPLPSTGFSGAIISRIATEAGSFCLRGWPRETLPRQRILGLHRLLRHASARGTVPVAVPVATESGATLIKLDDRLWQLEPWLPGRADFLSNPNEPRLRAIVASLAQWHASTIDFEPTAVERTWFLGENAAPSPAVAQRRRLIERWNSGRLGMAENAMRGESRSEFLDTARQVIRFYERVSPLIENQLQQAQQLSFRLQPCLRDIWHDHVLLTGDTVTGLIDASECRSENVATDLARLLGSLVGDDHAAWDSALDEYGRHHPLTLDERGLVHILDASGVLLSGMTWVERAYVDRWVFPQPERVLARLRAIHERLEHLAATID